MLVLSFLLCITTASLATVIFLNKIKNMNSRILYGILFAWGLFTILTWLIWLSSCHNHIKNIGPYLVPVADEFDTAYGYCFGLVLLGWIFHLISMFATSKLYRESISSVDIRDLTDGFTDGI